MTGDKLLGVSGVIQRHAGGLAEKDSVQHTDKVRRTAMSRP